MNVVVTGSGGYLGSLVAAHLRDAAHDVTGVDVAGTTEVDGIENRRGDVVGLRSDDDFVAAADAIVHLAAIPGIGTCADKPINATTANIETTVAVARVCRELRIPLVFASSLGVYGAAGTPITGSAVGGAVERNATTFYHQTKRASEDIIAAHAADTFHAVSLQMGSLYGSHSGGISKNGAVEFFINRANDGGPIPVHRPGTQTRDFVHVNDAARAYVAAIERLTVNGPVGGRLSMIPIATGRVVTIERVAEWAADEAGVAVEYVDHPGTPRWVGVADPSYARDALDWTPENDIEANVRGAVE